MTTLHIDKHAAEIMRAKMDRQYNCLYCKHGGDIKLFANSRYCSKRKKDPMPHVNDFEETVCNHFRHDPDAHDEDY